VLTVRVHLYPEAELAAVAVHAEAVGRRALPSAVRVVDLEVGVVVAALVPGRACAGGCCRRNAYRLLDDLLARARAEGSS
jgi:hypothetical protein